MAQQKFTATRDLICADGDRETPVGIRYHFTVTPARAASYGEPGEAASACIDRVMVSYGTPHWFVINGVADLALHVFGGDDAVEAWLLAEASKQSAITADDAADHKRQMQRECAL